jgi:hypothetical protein
LRHDQLTKWLIEEANADWLLEDNVGKTPMDVAALTPAYHGDLKNFIHHLLIKRGKEDKEEDEDSVRSLFTCQSYCYRNYVSFVFTFAI